MKEKRMNKTWIYFQLTIFSLITIVPFLWIFISSLRTMPDIVTRGPLALPENFRWENYVDAWFKGKFFIYYKNSIIISAATVVGVLITSTLAAYSFAYLKFKGKDLIYCFVILGLMIPGELIMIPLFNNISAMGLLNTKTAVILPQVAGTIPFGIFLLRGFMYDIPRSLMESARIDGATEGETLRHIIMPLVKPALISLIIFTMVWSWNSFMLPTILIQKDANRTVPLGLNHFRTKFSLDIPMTSAGSNIVAAPLIVIYLIFQRNIIKGMIAGAIKE